MLHRFLPNLLLIIALCACNASFAQVTTATLSGTITDNKGEEMIGTTIQAIHVPSGTSYGAVSNGDGRYTIPNMRVGGPYTVTVSFIGYQTDKRENITLALAQKLALNFKLVETSASLSEIVISADANATIARGRTGAETNIANDQLTKIPTINRSASDIYKLTPSSDGNSFGGRNDQFNNFSLDGTIFNNPFGLDAATPGGQTDAQPVSLDAIDQIQVSLAPYDVQQAGFTGAAVNAVTKSGTNTFKGTAYGFFRNNNMVGQKLKGNKSEVPDLTQGQYGFSLGGPIIKDKLFFFVNAEIERRQDLGTYGWVANRGTNAVNESRVLASDFELVSKTLKDNFGYETGAYEGFNHKTYNNKALVKLDYNLSQKHKLTFTGNWLDAFKDKPAHPSAIGRRGPDYTTMQFQNSGYRINNVIFSGIAELKSSIGSRMSNKLQVGASAFRDKRDPMSAPFPTIQIDKGGSRYIIAGHEPFSINNVLSQDVIQANDNFNIFLDKHTITIGASIEKFSFDNSFNLGTYPGVFSPGYASVADFVKAANDGSLKKDIDAAKGAFAASEKAGQGNRGGWALAETNVGQAAIYIQDEFQATPNFTVTAGVRVDKPLYFDTAEKIDTAIARACCYNPTIEYYDETGAGVKLDHTVLPSAKPLFSPRIGFNWDVKGDASMQLRGGSGLFTGRFPFVWIGNQVANPNFFFYCTTSPNFKFPQVWRTNLGYDQKFGEGWLASADVIYTKDINAQMTRNYGLKTPTGRLQGVDNNRPIYKNEDRAQVFGGPTNAYVFTTTNIGYTLNTTLQVSKKWANNMYASLGYNFGKAQDASSIDAEISSDAFDRNPAYGNINQAVLANSLYGNLHRVVGNVSKKFTYGNTATTVSAFFQYVKGGRYSYLYSGDINNDGSGLNDLIYIPTDSEVDKMNFNTTNGVTAEAQKAALKAYIAQDDYLSTNRGTTAEKYATLSPWYNNWDIRILQDFTVAGKGIQLSFDVLNAGNLINSNWGVRQTATTTQPIGVSVKDGLPTYSFDPNIKSTFSIDPSFASRFQAQVGLRVIF